MAPVSLMLLQVPRADEHGPWAARRRHPWIKARKRQGICARSGRCNNIHQLQLCHVQIDSCVHHMLASACMYKHACLFACHALGTVLQLRIAQYASPFPPMHLLLILFIKVANPCSTWATVFLKQIGSAGSVGSCPHCSLIVLPQVAQPITHIVEDCVEAHNSSGT
jgi:hypothetical protein